MGLKRHLDCEDWREGRGIPYAFRWLRDRKWTEKKKTVQSLKADRPPGTGSDTLQPGWWRKKGHTCYDENRG